MKNINQFKVSKRLVLGAAIVALGSCASVFAQAPATAQASAWPATTKIVVPLPAGGGVDMIVRKFAETLAPKLGTNVIVDNRPGASGLIAAKAASAGAADGSTILYLHPGLITMQTITGRLDISSEFKAITKLSSGPHLLLVPANSPYKTQAELLAAMKAQPGKLNYGSGGNGSPSHLAFEWMDEKTPGGVKATQIPFKGSVESVTALLGGEIDFTFSLFNVVHEHIKSGKLRALSITSSARFPMAPNVPTVAEAGIPGYVFDAWGGLVVPAKTPDAVVARLYEAAKLSANSPEFSGFIAKSAGVIEVSPSPTFFNDQLKTYLADEKKIVDRLGLKPQ